MKKIELTQGYYAIVDDQDYDELMQWSWGYAGGYAKRGHWVNGKRVSVRMHRYLMQPPDGMDVDHINRNKLDNRRSNLRVATRSQNMFNTGLRSTNSSGHKGIVWQKAAQKWQAQIMLHYKNYYLGLFDRLEDAVIARQQAEKELVI